MESGDYYSTANDFYSRISSAVDSRTGTFSASVSLVTGEGNHLRGPHASFHLGYSSFDVHDEGFGMGWRLRLTELDLKGKAPMLNLSSGETHRLEHVVEEAKACFPDRKLESCRLVTGPGLRSAVVTHATGIVEHLEVISLPGSDGDVMRTVRIVQPDGSALHVIWDIHDSGAFNVREIHDDDGVILLRIDQPYAGHAILSLFTHAADPLEVHFASAAGYLTRVTVPGMVRLNAEPYTSAADEAAWTFDYGLTDGMMLLESTGAPDGMRSEVTYAAQGIRLPEGSPRSHMPTVALHRRTRIAASSVVQSATRYRFDLYGDHNFYGTGVVDDWEDASDQLLHFRGGPYLYGSVETQEDADGTTLCTISRTFNQYHLMTRETTVRGTVVQDMEIRYGQEEGASFEDQPTDFQLPREVTRTLFDTRKESTKQVTVVTSSYDTMGNVLSRHDSATGITEVSEYYETEGDGDACPPDPLQLVHRLKSRAVFPADGMSPVMKTTYRYSKVPVRAGRSNRLNGRTYYVQAGVETLTEERTGTLLNQRQQLYFEDQGEQHGSVKTQVATKDGRSDRLAYEHVLDEVAGTIATTTIRTTFDDIVVATSETRHLVSGLVKCTTDTAGNRTEFTYDNLARLVSRVYAPDEAAYRTGNTWRYQVSNGERWVERRGDTGLLHRTFMDEQGRSIRQDEPMEGERTFTVREASFDIFGQLTSEVAHDRLGALDVTLVTHYAYDDWGQPSRVTAPDGSVQVSERSLVTVDGTVMMVTRQWTESVTGDRATGWQAGYVDAAGRQRRMETGHWNSTGGRVIVSAGEWTYDGLGRCIEQSDAIGNVTTQTWDAFDRLLTTRLPGGDVVTRTYAPGVEDELLATISLTPAGGERIELGRREYDGLGRLLVETAGSLTRTFSYTPGQMSAATSTRPDKTVIAHRYDPRLGEVLMEETLARTGSLLRKASYDTKLGLPKQLGSDAATMDIRTDFLGRMTEQDITVDGDATRHAVSVVSPGGLVLEREGVDGVRQRLTYDTLGRLARQADADVVLEFTYDALSRIASRTTTDARAPAHKTVQDFTYDDMGRIAAVGWTSIDETQTSRHGMTLSYREDNKVEGKRWTGTGDLLLRTEAMEYDARGRLVRHTTTAQAVDQLPVDEQDNPFREQCFAFDALDNLLSVKTTLADGRVNTTTYTYDAVDRDRVVTLENTLPGYPGSPRDGIPSPVVMTYDRNGALVDDGQGHRLEWDEAGRLARVTLPDATSLRYTHGPDGRIASVSHEGAISYRYYDEGALYGEFGKAEERRFIRSGTAVVAETRLAAALRTTWLLGSDPQGSVIIESGQDFAASPSPG